MKDGRSGPASHRKLPRGKLIANWPSYLLQGIPPAEREWLSKQARARNVSVSDVVRQLLCDRYRLDCPRESYYYDPGKDTGKPTMLLRLQPKLVHKLELEAARSGEPKSRIIRETITTAYEKGERE